MPSNLNGDPNLSLPEPDPFDYEACLGACARGELHALKRLYEHEGGRLLGVAKRIVRDHALAEDIVHDTFIKVWAAAGSFDAKRGSARGWIYSIARHLALNFVRDHARELPPADDEGLAQADATEALMHSGRLDGCLQQLEPERRECIVHAYVEGYSHAEIAHKLGTPLGTVKAWIKRSLTALRECMG